MLTEKLLVRFVQSLPILTAFQRSEPRLLVDATPGGRSRREMEYTFSKQSG